MIALAARSCLLISVSAAQPAGSGDSTGMADEVVITTVKSTQPMRIGAWHRARPIAPELITPGNHLRWDAERVREQLPRC